MTVNDCAGCGRPTTLSLCVRCAWDATHTETLEYISGVLTTFDRERISAVDPTAAKGAWATRFTDLSDALRMLGATEMFSPTLDDQGIEHALAVWESAEAALAVADAVRREADATRPIRRTLPKRTTRKRSS